ncbi:MAG: hypothetical protein WBO28_08245 [Flavobacteriales bacterium]
MRPRLTRTALWALGVFAITLAFLSVFWGPVLRSPNSYMFNTDGDGLKNYFTVAWHVKYDTSAFQFQGMNQPFGEQIDFVDAQPLLSNTLRTVSKIFPSVADEAVGVVNLFVLFGYAAAGLFLFLCLVELGCPKWASVGMAVGLALMEPQVMRTNMAHYSLAAPWVIPAVLYLFLRLRRAARTWPWAVGMAVLLFFLYRHHAYLAIMASAWLGLRWCLGLVRSADRSWRWSLVVAMVIPLTLHLLIGIATDHHTERTDHPTGFTDYQTGWVSLLHPEHLVHSPLANALIGARTASLEGLCYLGLGGMLMMLMLVLLSPVLFLRHKRGDIPAVWRQEGPAESLRMFGCSLPLLAFAFGFPFDPHHMDLLWDLPLVRQFRATGRFSWPFWNALALFSTVMLAAAARALPGRWRWAAMLPLVAAPVLYVYEGAYLHQFLGEKAVGSPNLFDVRGLDPDLQAVVKAVPVGTFRAILPLPFFHNGAEELMLPVDGPAFYVAQVVAMQTGIPMLASSGGRTSLWETRELIGLLAPGFYPRPLARHFAPTDRFLVLWPGNTLPWEDRDILERSTLLARAGTHELRSITAEELFADNRAAVVANARAERDSMYFSGGWWFSNKDTLLLYKSFDGEPATDHVYRGKSAMKCINKDFNVLAELGEGVLDTGKDYVASLWMYNRGPMRAHLFFGIDDIDPVNGEGAWHHYSDGRFSRILDGDWSFVEIPFRNHGAGHRHRLFVTSWDPVADTAWIDEVMIRAAGTHVQKWPADSLVPGSDLLMDGQFVPLIPRK